jgi:UDP-3-O-[3-hydroxymyristoyl] glucosamine N-acyltransferase
MQLSYTADEIAAIVQPRASRGVTTATIRGIAALSAARPGDLSFLGNPKYKAEVARTQASVVLVPPDYAADPGANQRFLVVDVPSVALARLCARIEQALRPPPAPGVHASAVVAPGARIAASASVGPLCVIEDGAEIGARALLQASVFVGRNAVVGDDCQLMPGVRLYAGTQLGRRVRLHANVVVGADGFGYELVDGRHEKVPQIGTAVIEDDVEIGAGTTVDRARFGRTVVGEGTKIDNLVQVGHNVVIGKHCILCGQVGISGSTTLDDYVVLGGQVGVGGHITIGRGVKAGGQAGIAASLPAGASVNGTPAVPFLLERRIAVLKQRLPEIFHRVDLLEEQVRRLGPGRPGAAGAK